MPRLPVVVFVLAVVAAGAWLAFGRGAPAPGGNRAAPAMGGPPGMGRPLPVNVARVREEEFSDRLEAIGTTSANESITVTARAQGIIRALRFEDGQTVNKGDEIATIDAGEQDAKLNVELANLDEQRKGLERTAGLAKSQNVSQSKLDEQTAALRKAEANVAAARARIADYRIVAPFGGILGTRKVSVGALVSPGTVVTTLDDISVVKLDFAVPENFLSALRPGLDIEATTAAYPGEIFKGQVLAVDSRVDPVTRSIAIRALMPNPDLRLRPGMLMIVDLIKNRRQSLVIPEQALIPDPSAQFVFVISPDNVASRVKVTIGRRRLGYVEILEGLSAGDLVVTEGTIDVRPGGKVDVINRDKLGTAAPPTATAAAPRPS
jgi:membrane fusion protein (multidrug efflux system)